MMRLAAAALCLSNAALGAPPAGWKTCGGLPDNYTSTACDTATSTVSLLRVHRMLAKTATPREEAFSLTSSAHPLSTGCCAAVRDDGLATVSGEMGLLPASRGCAVPGRLHVLPERHDV